MQRLLALTGVALLCAACPASVDEVCHDTACGIPTPAGCNPDDDVKNQASCVVSSFGVFVDPDAGIDTNPGTKEAPMRTVKTALANLAGKSRIYLCDGSYDEHVVVDGATSLFGGFACGTWQYSGGRAKLAPTSEGPSLVVSHASSPIVLADLEMRAKDATAHAGSSITAFVRNNTATITLRRVTAHAGNASATAAPTPETLANGFFDATAGKSANGIIGGPERICACAVEGQSVGGRGGDGAATASSAKNGDPGTATPSSAAIGAADSHAGVGKTSASGSVCTAGGDGSNGSHGLGGTGASSLGTLTDDGWTAAPGANGEPGHPGVGGGGGGGGTDSGGAGGGGGGGGGCAGAGGAGGTGGGSSFTIVVAESTVVIEQSELFAGTPEPGGNAAGGGLSVEGGAGAPAAAGACGGGRGGDGAGGSGGGGGGGGSSVGILYRGIAPTVDTATMITTAGAGAPGGAVGKGGIGAKTGSGGASGTRGTAGVADRIHAL